MRNMNVFQEKLTRSRNTPNSYHTCSGTESLTVRTHVCVQQKFDLCVNLRSHLSNSGQVRGLRAPCVLFVAGIMLHLSLIHI